MLLVAVTTLVLFFATGMYSEKIAYAHKCVPLRLEVVAASLLTLAMQVCTTSESSLATVQHLPQHATSLALLPFPPLWIVRPACLVTDTLRTLCYTIVRTVITSPFATDIRFIILVNRLNPVTRPIPLAADATFSSSRSRCISTLFAISTNHSSPRNDRRRDRHTRPSLSPANLFAPKRHSDPSHTASAEPSRRAHLLVARQPAVQGRVRAVSGGVGATAGGGEEGAARGARKGGVDEVAHAMAPTRCGSTDAGESREGEGRGGEEGRSRTSRAAPAQTRSKRRRRQLRRLVPADSIVLARSARRAHFHSPLVHFDTGLVPLALILAVEIGSRRWPLKPCPHTRGELF